MKEENILHRSVLFAMMYIQKILLFIYIVVLAVDMLAYYIDLLGRMEKKKAGQIHNVGTPFFCILRS